MSVFERKEFGNINFGSFRGTNWNELKLTYLDYLISSECNTSIANKNIARLVLENKNNLNGQDQWDF